MKHIRYIVGMVTLFILSGCHNRYYLWIEDVFNQGTSLNKFTTVPAQYIRSIRVYDQFSTIGIFDALLLDDCVRDAYVNLYSLKHCLSSEQKRTMYAHQKEENERFISFYLLAYYPTNMDCLLNYPDSIWTVRLVSNGSCYAPADLRVVQLPLEYQTFFGKRFTVFKRVYSVKFNANILDDQPEQKLTLMLRSIGHQVELTWRFDQCGNLLAPCSNDQNVLAYDVDCEFSSCAKG